MVFFNIFFIAVAERMDVTSGHAVGIGIVAVIVMRDDAVVAVIGGEEMKGIDDAVLLECFHDVAVALGRDLAEGVSVLSGRFSMLYIIWLDFVSPVASNWAYLSISLEFWKPWLGIWTYFLIAQTFYNIH